MLLNRKVAFRMRVLLVDIIDDLFVVDEDANVIALGNDFLGKPRIRFVQLFRDLGKIVKAARALRVGGEGAVDLGFVAVRVAGHERGSEILAGIPLVRYFGDDLVMEVGVIALLRKEMARVTALADNAAIRDAPVARIFWMGLPAGEVFAVEKLHPAVGVLRDLQRGQAGEAKAENE